jgi:parallel beta-helix repeat protein
MRYSNVRATGPLGLVAFVLFASVSNAATYYVATNGNDSNPGSSSNPWRTLQKAANTARAGDVVLVANGTYVGFQVTADGTSSSPIVFRANGSNVIINARNATTPDNVNIEGGNYVTVEGFIVNDAPRVGIRAVTATGVVIRNNVISRSGLDGILTGYTPQIQIIDNVASGSLQEHGIYVSNSTSANDNPVVRGNECFDNNQNGMQFNGDCDAGGDGIISGAVIEGNVIHHNNWKGFSLISLQNSSIRNNLVYENGLSAGAGGIHLADQPGCNKPSSNNVIVNNTVHEPRIACIRMTNGSTGNTIFNNLLVGRSLAYTIADEVGGNYIDLVSNLKLTSVAGLFEGVGAGDYHLLPACPAVNTAVFAYHSVSAPTIDHDGTPRPQGLLYDAGAFEHGSATAVGDAPSLRVALEQNAPNPFGTSTRIVVRAPGGEARVALDVFDARGRRVRGLLQNRLVSGSVDVVWDARDDRGRSVPSGVYFCRLTSPEGVMTRRMTLVR